METGMREDSETIGQRTTVGGRGFGREEEPREGSARVGWSAEETVGQMETLGGDGRVLLAGRYRVVKRLGEGGMGSVWLAEDGKLEGRKVAVKMLPSVLAGKKGAYRQVKAEAMVAMKLSHPNIATVRAFEEDEGGNPFLVMDYVDGEGLDDILAERGPLGEEETGRLLGPVAAALDYAHERGVVHRDVKPGNVMVAKDGTPYVLDFGIAREVQETMTRVTGKLSSGTLLYMSPEQLRGKGPKAAQDVYSFAAMAYECLTGQPPFARGQIEWQIVNEAPEALPESMGEALRAGVMAGLAKEPEGRPGSCAGVLGGKVKGQTSNVEGQRSKVEGQRPKGGGRGRWRWMLAALALSAGVGVWWWGGKNAGGPPAPPRETRLEAASPEEAAQRAAEEESARMEAERVRAEREERIRQESEELEETVYRLAPMAKTKAENVQGMGYDRGQGFGEKLDGMQSMLEQGEAAMGGRNFGKAKEWFEASMAAAAWCEENAPLREAAARARAAAAGKKSAAEAMDGVHLGLTAWNKAEKARRAAEGDFAAARFKEATAGWNAAGAAYGESEAAARAAKVEQGLEAARGAKRRGAWEECLKAAEGVLALAGGNAEAKRLKEEAEGKIAGETPAPPVVAGGVVALDLGGGVTLEMVHCPGVAGDFWMGKTEVTQEQWQRVTGKNPSYFAGKPKNPVERVSWNDCTNFVAKLNALPAARASGLTFRLPTEEEWKTACRAGAPKSQNYCKLADGTQITVATLSKVARFGKGWDDGPVAVGSFLPNAWGLHDMHGNVWEWTQTADGVYRVSRGGGFDVAAGYCAAGDRFRYDPDLSDRYLGLRLAASGRAATR
jgi:hypothetical protein